MADEVAATVAASRNSLNNVGCISEEELEENDDEEEVPFLSTHINEEHDIVNNNAGMKRHSSWPLESTSTREYEDGEIKNTLFGVENLRVSYPLVESLITLLRRPVPISGSVVFMV